MQLVCKTWWNNGVLSVICIKVVVKGLDHRLYADYTQLFFSFHPLNFTQAFLTFKTLFNKSLRGWLLIFLLVLLRFQKFCCRSVSVGFCKKNRSFRFGFGFCLSRFPPVVNVVRLCGPLHIKLAAVRYIFLCITPVGSSKYATACDWWRENHHLYPMSRTLRNATCLAVCATDIRC